MKVRYRERETFLQVNSLTTDFSTYAGKLKHSRMQIVSTSRVCKEIKSKINPLKDATTLCFIDASALPLDRTDIEGYVKGRLAELDQFSPEGKGDLWKRLGHDSAGNFKWASLMLEALRHSLPNWVRSPSVASYTGTTNMREQLP